jgi:predicted TIM-barrel fold metal-dependent hydrolase
MADDASVLNYAKTEPFFGEILDADGHTYPNPAIFRDGPGVDFGGDFGTSFLKRFTASDEFQADRARNRQNVWDVKGIGALGAYDADERIEAFNMMGVRAQLLFPAGTNDEAIEFQRRTDGRGRAAVRVDMSDPAACMVELDRVIKLGARHLNLPCAEPPGGVSPAHEQWDPFWGRCAEAEVAVTLHLACSGMLSGPKPMFPDRAWGDASALRNKPAERAGGEEAISPWFMMIAHMGAETYLQAMVMGGVFERFPKLRFGIIELGAKWIGPCVERMDLWTDFMAKVGKSYPMKPSEYVQRNVRVTPFWHENLALMIQRFGLEDVYVFSTDYPHLEGSRDPIGKFRKHLAKLPEAYARKFMVENAALLFPGL